MDAIMSLYLAVVQPTDSGKVVVGASSGPHEVKEEWEWAFVRILKELGKTTF